MAAARNSTASRVLTALSWTAAAYLLALLSAYYFHFWGIKRHHLEAAWFILISLLFARNVTRSDADAEGTATRRALSLGLVTIGLVVLGTAIYWPVIRSGLFADDYVLLQAAREGRFTVWTQLFRPTIFVVWRVIDRLPADTALLLHATNAGLHVANGATVVALARRLGLSDPGSAIAGFLFVGFPASVEAVAWPSGLQDVLMTTFVLGFLVIALQSTAERRGIIAGVALLLAALFTKETAVVAPALAALLSVALPANRRPSIHASVAAAIVAIFVLIRFTLLPLPAGYVGALDRYQAKEIVVRPFASLGVPLREVETAGFALVALILSALVVLMLCRAASQWNRMDRRFHFAMASALFVLVSIAPVHAYFSVTADLFGSRYLYLGSVAWALLLAALAQGRSTIETAVRSTLLAAVLVIWTVFAHRHATVWREAALTRDRILVSAQQMPTATCAAWAVHGLPAVVDGVPVFVNGFPEAMRMAGRTERFHVAPETLEPGECRVQWTGSAFAIVK